MPFFKAFLKIWCCGELGFVGKSPQIAFQSDSKALRFLSPETITNAFLHCEERKVDKAGCISFMNRKYEVGLTFIGRTVDVVYDTADISELTIEYESHKPFHVHELVIGPRAGKRPKLPEYTQLEFAEYSRLLAAAGHKHQERREQQHHAVSYRTVSKEV